MNISKNDSERITSLRFLLMCLVVFLHVQTEDGYNGNICLYVQKIFTACSSDAVNIFFLISSYLLFLKGDRYPVMLKKKMKNVILPYFLWPASFLFFVKILPKLIASIFFPDRLDNPWIFYTSDWTFVDYFRFFFFYAGKLQHPYWLQFWFLRQLIFMIIISPLIYFLARKTAVEFLIALFVIAVGAIPAINDVALYIVFTPLLFFYMGALCAIYNFSFFSIADKVKWWSLIVSFSVGFVLLNILKMNLGWTFLVFYMFIKCLILLKFSSFLVQKNEKDLVGTKVFSILKNLSGYSFFLYAIHLHILNPFLSFLYKKCFTIDNDLKLLGHFFFVSTGDIILAVFLGMLLKRLAPKIYNLYTGGR